MVNESCRASGSKWSIFFFFPSSSFSSHRGVPLRDRRWRQRQAVSKSVETEEMGLMRVRQAVHTGNDDSRNSWQTGLIWSLTAGVFTAFTCTITAMVCNRAQRVTYFSQLSNGFLWISSETSSVRWFWGKGNWSNPAAFVLLSWKAKSFSSAFGVKVAANQHAPVDSINHTMKRLLPCHLHWLINWVD